MHRMFRSHVTYANVMATIAVFLVVSGGTAVALSGANTVFSDDIVDHQVKSQDLATLAFTPVRPNPQQPNDPCESGEVGIFCAFVGSSGYRGWKNLGRGSATVAYARDGLGIVHLQGAMVNPGPPHGPAFVLPPGYRPGARLEFAVAYGINSPSYPTPTESLSTVQVRSDGAVDFEEQQPGAGTHRYEGVWLDGIEFKAK